MGKTWRRFGKKDKNGKENFLREDEWRRRKKMRAKQEEALRKKREVKTETEAE